MQKDKESGDNGHDIAKILKIVRHGIKLAINRNINCVRDKITC